MEYINISILTVFIICETLFSINIMRLYQLNNYKIVLNTKILKECLSVILVFALSILPYIVSFTLNIDLIWSEIIMICILSIYLMIQKLYRRQKVVFTHRLVRLFITSMFLSISSIILIYIYLRALLCITILLIFLEIVIANYINFPIEAMIRKKYLNNSKSILQSKNPLVIGITGSCGKTTVKNILNELLSIKYKVLMTPKSYNTLMGICLSINKLTNQEIFIVEMGARRKKDISKICEFAQPKIGIVTGLTKQHLKTFKSIDNIYDAKKELQQSSSIDIMFYNDTNTYLNKMKNEFHNSCGIEDLDYRDLGFDGEYQKFQFFLNNHTYIVKTKLVGKHNIENILLCIKVALYLNIDIVDILEKIKTIDSISNRCEIKHLANNITLIDDSYNANILGCLNTLGFLNNFNGRKIVFTQGIVELGKDQYLENKKLGLKIATIADYVILLGVNKKAILEGLKTEGFSEDKIIILKSFSKINKTFKNILKEGDVVLIQNDLTDNY